MNINKIRFPLYLLLALTFLLDSCQKPSDTLIIQTREDFPQLDFALSEISSACQERDIGLVKGKNDIHKGIKLNFILDTTLGFESYRIAFENDFINIRGGDPNGLMYAGLELADWIRLEKDLGQITTIEASPYIKYRGLRYNIPLDARTPSYDDTGDAAQKNIATVWDLDYWKEYLDRMAKYRYNLLTFWNLHPYPSWVQLEDYPDVALENVCKYKGQVDKNTHMKWKGEGNQDPDSLEVIIEMSMDEKIAFWKSVFQYAQDRGIDIYIFHWNVFVNGAEGKHGIEWKQDNPVTVDYIRQSVKQFLLTYPNIKGIGVTAGEHINRDLQGKYATENWMWLTYGQGIMDAKKEKPDLEARFIFRRHWSDLDDIMEAFKEYEGKFETSFKYSRARMYSSTSPPWFDKIYRETVEKSGIPCWLNVRNDDIFTFRWGDPEYARDYILNMPRDLSPGFYMGPDGYVWGREHISKNSSEPRQLDIDKHWYRFMIWGRTAYNPNISEQFFIEQIKQRFPGVNSVKLYNTWTCTSDIISLVDKIHFRQNDAQFLPSGCFDKSGFHDVNDFIAIGAMPEQGVCSIAEYALNPEECEGMTPFDVAEELDRCSEKLISGSASIDPSGNEELEETLSDLKALGLLGKYYALKIRGATRLAQYRVHGDEADKEKAIDNLSKAVSAWQSYSEAANALYTPQLMARTQRLDWDGQLEHVKKDVEIARSAEHNQEVKVRDDNKLWNRDRRRF